MTPGHTGNTSILPGSIPMAKDNAVFAARHIHVVATHPGHAQLVSLIFFKGDAALAPNPCPELAIALGSARTDGRQTLFGRSELILSPR
jgi:protocatechuate 3,4-dioxygenase beta subunit